MGQEQSITIKDCNIVDIKTLKTACKMIEKSDTTEVVSAFVNLLETTPVYSNFRHDVRTLLAYNDEPLKWRLSTTPLGRYIQIYDIKDTHCIMLSDEQLSTFKIIWGKAKAVKQK